MDIDFHQEKRELLQQTWTYQRDNFFDDKFNGVNWPEMRKQYEPLFAPYASSYVGVDHVDNPMAELKGAIEDLPVGDASFDVVLCSQVLEHCDEPVKAVSELYSPVAGEVVEINSRLDGEPALVNSDPYGDGWMIKLRLANAADLDSLLSADAYRAHIGG